MRPPALLRRLAAAAAGISRRPRRQPNAPRKPAVSAQGAGAESPYPGLPGPALKQAVEASVAGVPLGRHRLTRLAMYEALSGRLAAEDRLSRRCLAISGSARLADVLGLRAAKIVQAAYPEHTMLALRFDDASFDFCVSDQVLEHVEGDPFDAVRESFRVVRPGGWVVHTTCLLNPIHREPGDFWRFTPDALELLAKSAGGAAIETGSWGNRQALAVAMAGARMVKVALDEAHPLHRIAVANEPDWPIHTWLIAQRPV
ncbi:MAG: methyltransferase domain-containing protein [Propylenella sp.]